ncbi:uncharacterized protein LOC126907796 isoform X2 [Daktulosphaira vitifoliae]|uniref:uncharacterized protein LOC126907796 isoform X2 n=1 Tax=Daktulosphaira vitifoliae TaxID=58002 RepID=UPI0021AA064D|nr:uncharacterized protein LOC126907796 isoform X2 [Daktulosphaira vitifoliae]
MKENILIFFLILSVDAKHRSHKIKQLKVSPSQYQIKENVKILNKFFENPEWQNFKDIKKVKYLRKEYTKEKISEIQIKSKTIYINTRVATLFLACTYDRKNEVELDINMFCEVVPECLKSAWANLLEKYNNILKNKQEIYFYDFLHKEINEIIKSSIEEKYDKFGFTYDQDTIINQMLPPNPKKRRLTSHKCIPDLKVETIP